MPDSTRPDRPQRRVKTDGDMTGRRLTILGVLVAVGVAGFGLIPTSLPVRDALGRWFVPYLVCCFVLMLIGSGGCLILAWSAWPRARIPVAVMIVAVSFYATGVINPIGLGALSPFPRAPVTQSAVPSAPAERAHMPSAFIGKWTGTLNWSKGWRGGVDRSTDATVVFTAANSDGNAGNLTTFGTTAQMTLNSAAGAKVTVTVTANKDLGYPNFAAVLTLQMPDSYTLNVTGQIGHDGSYGAVGGTFTKINS